MPEIINKIRKIKITLPPIKPEDLQDRKIVMIVNLAPRKLRGIESQGMLLAAVSDDHKKVILVNPGDESDPGMKIS